MAVSEQFALRIYAVVYMNALVVGAASAAFRPRVRAYVLAAGWVMLALWWLPRLLAPQWRTQLALLRCDDRMARTGELEQLGQTTRAAYVALVVLAAPLTVLVALLDSGLGAGDVSAREVLALVFWTVLLRAQIAVYQLGSWPLDGDTWRLWASRDSGLAVAALVLLAVLRTRWAVVLQMQCAFAAPLLWDQERVALERGCPLPPDRRAFLQTRWRERHTLAYGAAPDSDQRPVDADLDLLAYYCVRKPYSRASWTLLLHGLFAGAACFAQTHWAAVLLLVLVDRFFESHLNVVDIM
jgi:hypothetical protein